MLIEDNWWRDTVSILDNRCDWECGVDLTRLRGVPGGESVTRWRTLSTDERHLGGLFWGVPFGQTYCGTWVISTTGYPTTEPERRTWGTKGTSTGGSYGTRGPRHSLFDKDRTQRGLATSPRGVELLEFHFVYVNTFDSRVATCNDNWGPK